MRQTRQRGNILFLILLAIILFVALSYAVMNQREQVGQGMSSEQLDAKAAMIIQYTTLLEQTVHRLRLTGGCRDTEFSFASTAFTIPYTNMNAPSDKHCHVFDPAGGGMSVNTAVFDETSGTTAINGSADTINSGSAVLQAGTDCPSENTCNDIIVHLNLGTDSNAQALCQRLNLKLGNPTTSIYAWAGLGYDRYYNGTYYVPAQRILGGILTGRLAGCYFDQTSTINGVDMPHYSYYHVLLAR